jgi:hypothetical protein
MSEAPGDIRSEIRSTASCGIEMRSSASAALEVEVADGIDTTVQIEAGIEVICVANPAVSASTLARSILEAAERVRPKRKDNTRAECGRRFRAKRNGVTGDGGQRNGVSGHERNGVTGNVSELTPLALRLALIHAVGGNVVDGSPGISRGRADPTTARARLRPRPRRPPGRAPTHQRPAAAAAQELGLAVARQGDTPPERRQNGPRYPGASRRQSRSNAADGAAPLPARAPARPRTRPRRGCPFNIRQGAPPSVCDLFGRATASPTS